MLHGDVRHGGRKAREAVIRTRGSDLARYKLLLVNLGFVFRLERKWPAWAQGLDRGNGVLYCRGRSTVYTAT